jgi:predicted deacylase
MWIPPEQPDYSYAEKRYTSTQFIEQLWEPLRLANPDYISREVRGQDTTGQYDIYSYTFAPPSYGKTFLITANLHGGEILGQMALYRFLWHLTNDADSHPALTYLRQNVRFVVIPIANPWAVDVPGRARGNASGVDLNRNFDYLWGSYTSASPIGGDYKGPFPFSEVEARLVRDWLDQHQDADVYFDIHNGNRGMAHYTSYVPVGDATAWIPVDRVIAAFQQEGELVERYRVPFPMAINYAATQYGMLALTPEFPLGGHGERPYDSADMYHAVRWYGNLIIQYATWGAD